MVNERLRVALLAPPLTAHLVVADANTSRRTLAMAAWRAVLAHITVTLPQARIALTDQQGRLLTPSAEPHPPHASHGMHLPSRMHTAPKAVPGATATQTRQARQHLHQQRRQHTGTMRCGTAAPVKRRWLTSVRRHRTALAGTVERKRAAAQRRKLAARVDIPVHTAVVARGRSLGTIRSGAVAIIAPQLLTPWMREAVALVTHPSSAH